MKKTLLMMALAFGLSAGTAMAQDAKPANATPVAPASKWDETVHDFGTIPQGTPATNTFKFKNNGKTPIVIQSANASCGCTAPEFSKDPILPKKEGTIKATYNAASAGPFSKTVTVTFNNGEAPTVLVVKGTVVEKK